ncbi:response regulator transcription factor [Streptomyces sp. LS1784]|uniref:response regulator n=1 Tax=Streptomyces sp. LS1784 TaxID=2851533 RepID=UPI001CC9B402|nr:response regulator transcription factor [Streptomyces sp. LS1784]
MIHVVVVDDEALIRSGLELVLNIAEDIRVVAAISGGQAMAAVMEHTPDLVLLDVRMPDIDGLTLLRRLMELAAPPVVAMLTTFDHDAYVASALRAGASGFLLKDVDPDTLASQVRDLMTGRVVLSAEITTAVVAGYLEHHRCVDRRAHETVSLSERERNILILLAEGLSNTEIGQHLHLSMGTIKDNIGALLRRLGLANRLQAALWAQRAGLLPHDRNPGRRPA